MVVTVRHDPGARRFVAEAEGHVATLQYELVDDGTVDFQSTYVPAALRRMAVGSQLVRAALTWARAGELKVVPSCWFVATVVARHPEFQDLLV